MERESLKKRGLLLTLMVSSVVIFISLVWIFATRASRGLQSTPISTLAVTQARVEANCAYPIGYWEAHPELYPSQIVLGSQVYKADEVSKVLSDQSGGQRARLQAQLIGAFLNILSGADQSFINSTIFQAYGWIVDHPGGTEASEADLQAGARLYNLLEAYNLGLAGVPACQGAAAYAATVTLGPTETIALSPTGTPSETPTPTPSPSASPTTEFIYPTWTVAVSSPTRTPTVAEPNEPPEATETTAPTREPTETPEPPTEEPSPTDTETPEPTLPPPP
jgi:hypothetical protein